MNSETIINHVKSHHKKIKNSIIKYVYDEIDRFAQDICSPFIELEFDESNIDSLKELLPIVKYWKKQIEDYDIYEHTIESAPIIKQFRIYNEKITELEAYVKSLDEKKFQEEQLKLEKKKFRWDTIISILALIISIIALIIVVIYR